MISNYHLKQLFIRMEKTTSSYPSHHQMLKNLLSEAYKTAKQGLGGDKILAEKSTVEKRLECCANCDKFNASEKRCIICGCLMTVKANLEASSCPDEKW
ncbi:DUF6171 family protein [Pelatocladus sp. BLCC-F211]